MEDGIYFNQSKYIKEMLKKFGLEDSKPTKIPMSTEIKLTKDGEANSVDSLKYQGLIMLVTNQNDYKDTKVYLLKIYRTKYMPREILHKYITLEDCLIHEGRYVTPSFIEAKKILPLFRDVGLESFLTLDEPICPRFVAESYHSFKLKRDEDEYPYIEFNLGSFTFELTTSQHSWIFKTPTKSPTFYTNDWSLNSLNGHPNNRFFGPEHELVKKTITIPRTTQSQPQRDPNKLFRDDLRPKLKGWELFLRENVFCILRNRDHVNACNAYMLYYLAIKKTFDLTNLIVLRVDDVKRNTKTFANRRAFGAVFVSAGRAGSHEFRSFEPILA
ncbi:hypothetical protein Tco_0312109 [Tanacetum coccineum]